MQLKEYFANYLPILNEEMKQTVGDLPTPALAGLYGMIHYHHGWADVDLKPANVDAGKRIRPLLCILTCEASGGDPFSALPAAAGLELLHNFTLIHDDVEDVSDLRRGRLTLWKVWGIAQAINSGDAVHAIAHTAFHRLKEYGVPAEQRLAAHLKFSETCLRVTHGQYLDINFETRNDVTADEYIEMIEGKTAALLGGSAAIGAIIAGSDQACINHFYNFGLGMGLAYQVIDDLLGIWGDPKVTGKSSAMEGSEGENDISSRKKTLPVLYGLGKCEELREVYTAHTMDVPLAVRLLEETGAKEYAEKIAEGFTQKAMNALKEAQPQNVAGELLQKLANKLLKRQD